MNLSLFLQRVIDHSNLRMFTELVLDGEHVRIDLNNSASKRFGSFVITPHISTNAIYYEIINNNDRLVSVSTTYHAYIDTKHYDLKFEDKILKISTSKGNISFDASNYNKIQLVKKNESIYDLSINFQTKSIKGNSKMTVYLSDQRKVKLCDNFLANFSNGKFKQKFKMTNDKHLLSAFDEVSFILLKGTEKVYRNIEPKDYIFKIMIGTIPAAKSYIVYFKIDNYSHSSTIIYPIDEDEIEAVRDIKVPIPENLTAGKHVVTVWAKDPHRNLDSDNDTISFTFIIPPELTIRKYPSLNEEVYEAFKITAAIAIYNGACNVSLNYSIGNYHHTNPQFRADVGNITTPFDILLPTNMYGEHEISFQVYDDFYYSAIEKFTVKLKYPLPSIFLNDLKFYNIDNEKSLKNFITYNYTDNINEDKNYNLTFIIDDNYSKFLGNFIVDENSLNVKVYIPSNLEHGHHNISFFVCNTDHHRCNQSNYIYFFFKFRPPTHFPLIYRLRKKSDLVFQ